MNRIKRKKVGVNSSQMQISSFFKPISRSMSNSTDEKDKVLEFSTKCNTENQESKETVESPLLKRRKQTIENADPPRFHNLKPLGFAYALQRYCLFCPSVFCLLPSLRDLHPSVVSRPFVYVDRRQRYIILNYKRSPSPYKSRNSLDIYVEKKL